MQFALPPDLVQFVEHQLALGHYQSAEDVVSQGLRLLQERERRLQELRDEVRPALESLDRGEGIFLEDDDALRAYFDDLKAHGRERQETRYK